MTTAADHEDAGLETEAAIEETDSNYLDMTDEEILKMGNPPASELEAQAPGGASGDDPDAGADGEAAKADDEQDEEIEKPVDDAAGKKADTPAAADPLEKGSAAGDDAKDPTGKDTKVGDGDKGDAPTPINYESEYKKLLAPFRANGKDMQVESVDDAIQLMKMGANYNKKMAGMKPGLKVLKLLENNNLLDEDRLSFLIDLDKKKPEAITQLLKDSKIDPLDLNVQDESNYKPTKYAVSDSQIALDETLDELKESPRFDTLMTVVGTQWDAKSKQVVASNPQLLKVIDDHMASGVYDLISTEVEKRRMLGSLSGSSDLESYKAVGDELNAAGKFAHLFQPEQQQAGKVVVTGTPQTKAAAPGAADKRKEVSPTRTGTTQAKDPDFNPLNMSDEEFTKQLQSKFL